MGYRLSRIYTRTGDDGTTGLVDGSRAPKHSPRLEAIGAVDEANSALGFAAAALEGEGRDALTRIQNDLFDLGADLATPDVEKFTVHDTMNVSETAILMAVPRHRSQYHW